LQKTVLKKAQPGGFFCLSPSFVRRPNLTGSGIFMGFQLLERALLARYSLHQINIRHCGFIVSFITSQEQFIFLSAQITT